LKRGIRLIRKSPYLIQTKNDIENISKELEINPEYCSDIIDTFFKSIRNIVNTDDRMPIIKLPIIGQFNPTISSIRRMIGGTLRLYYKGKIPKFVAQYRIKKYWALRNRLIYEDRGYNMYREWIGVDKEYRKYLITEELEEIVNDFYKRKRTPKMDF